MPVGTSKGLACNMKGKLLAIAALSASLACATGATIAQWNFNSPTPDGSPPSGTTAPSTGSGLASLVGSVTATFSDGSTNDPAPASDDSGWNTTHYPAQGTSNKMAGVQFNISTLGYSNIVVRWDLRVTGTASKYYRLQYSTNGSSFLDYPTPTAALLAAPSPSYYEGQTNSLAAITTVNNNANFGIRIVSEFESTAAGGTAGYVTTLTNGYSGSSGTVRFDLVTISGTAIPGANTPPVISSVSNQTIRVNQSTSVLPLTIGDAEDAPANLTLNRASSDPAIIANANISFGGSGSNRTVTVTAGNQPGSSLLTIYVIDTGGRSNSTSFTVTVLPNNTAPFISSIPSTNTLINVATPAIGFMVGDLETPAGSLTVSASSANPALAPNGNIVFGGSGSNRTVTLTPANGQMGVAPITITVSDGTNSAASIFPLMVIPSSSVIFYDPFAYTAGSLLTNSGFLWATRSGTSGECLVTNGQLQVTGIQTEDVVGPLIGGPYVKSNGTVLYASFKANVLTLPKPVPGLFAHFANGSTLRGRIYAGTTNAAPGSFRCFVANGSDTNTALATDLSLNTSYTLVTRYNIDTATTTLWLNPVAESDPGVAASDSQAAATVASYGFRQDSDVGATILIDDLKVGLSFAAVMGAATSNTPIPLTLQLRGGKTVLMWNNPAFSLQSSVGAGGPYTNITTARSPYTNTPVGGARFFRLIYP